MVAIVITDKLIIVVLFLKYDNDSSAGSPTETLLRLLPESLPLKGIAFLEAAQSRTATGDIYKGQGRNQRELMIHIS
ncbi:hypothetical protein WUBG_04165 [Wuchereria bancrofti]|uniref:Uncharacterized protein n=1 Tax=Wuchereria bancrofti TaxID=6293 RepID=J9F5Z5_WUCBA|nr:hypothetical protein WUBG_04165 [Wuchereria bancrofti]